MNIHWQKTTLKKHLNKYKRCNFRKPKNPQAQWYSGLNYVAKGEKNEAKEVFGALAGDTSSNNEKAKSILNQL